MGEPEPLGSDDVTKIAGTRCKTDTELHLRSIPQPTCPHLPS